MIQKGVALSELNHPESSLIDLDRVSHLITDMWWEDNFLMGKIKLLPIASQIDGKIASELVKKMLA